MCPSERRASICHGLPKATPLPLFCIPCLRWSESNPFTTGHDTPATMGSRAGLVLAPLIGMTEPPSMEKGIDADCQASRALINPAFGETRSANPRVAQKP
jgi:hypothetical protein